MSEKWEFDIALKSLSQSKNILEIGSALGSFMKACLHKGLSATGIELNEAAVKIAKDRGLPVAHADIHQYVEEYPESSDAVCSFQVLEHIPDPKSFIESSLKALRKRGMLVLSVPNSESFLKYQNNLLDMPPHHMTRWSEASFKALEKIFPIRLEKVFFEPLAAYHVSDYMHAYAQHFWSRSSTTKLFFNRYTLPIFTLLISKKSIRRLFRGQTILALFRKL